MPLKDDLNAADSAACDAFVRVQRDETASDIMETADTLKSMAFDKMLAQPDKLMQYHIPETHIQVSDHQATLALERVHQGRDEDARAVLNAMSFEEVATTYNMASKITQSAERVQAEQAGVQQATSSGMTM